MGDKDTLVAVTEVDFSGHPTSPCRSKLPTSLRRSKLRKAMSDKPGGYVGQGVEGIMESKLLDAELVAKS
jgi:hypothetical protein